MGAQPDHLLERLIHYLFYGSAEEPRFLIAEAQRAGMDAFALFGDLLWPAMECTQQLRHCGLLPPRVFNHAGRVLTSLAARLLPAAAPASGSPRLFIVSAPGEPADTGAQLLATLAEARGMTALFAGVNVSTDEICFALPRLQADVVVVQGSITDSLDATEALLKRLQQRALWPGVQLAATGAMLARQGSAAADVSSLQPSDLLELLLLCPDQRRPEVTPPPSSPPPQPKVRKEVLAVPSVLSYFPSRFRNN